MLKGFYNNSHLPEKFLSFFILLGNPNLTGVPFYLGSCHYFSFIRLEILIPLRFFLKNYTNKKKYIYIFFLFLGRIIFFLYLYIVVVLLLLLLLLYLHKSIKNIF